MKSSFGEAGPRGTSVRSDCWAGVAPRAEGGIELHVRTKVEAMYGDAVRATCREVLRALGVRHAVVTLEDYGALDYVLAARLEVAVSRAGLAVGAAYLPARAPGQDPAPERDRLRRSRLYLPGNQPKHFLNASLHQPDGIILDLEDSVPHADKDAARVLVRNALRAVDFGHSERMVRINPGEQGLEDVDAVVPQNAQLLLIPKVESAEQVRVVDERAQRARHAAGLSGPCLLMPIIESARGCFAALEIATASPNVVALTIGLEDYTADIGAERTAEGRESLWARQVVVNAARAAGVAPIDSVFADVDDADGLRRAVVEARSLGYEGKGCIHPRQVPIVHDAFMPPAAEVERAKRIVLAAEDAERRGLAVVALGSKMIDAPVVKRALRLVRTAEAVGSLRGGWREAAAVHREEKVGA